MRFLPNTNYSSRSLIACARLTNSSINSGELPNAGICVLHSSVKSSEKSLLILPPLNFTIVLANYRHSTKMRSVGLVRAIYITYFRISVRSYTPAVVLITLSSEITESSCQKFSKKCWSFRQIPYISMSNSCLHICSPSNAI